MSDPNSTPDATPPVPEAPSYTYGETAPTAPAAASAQPTYGEQVPAYGQQQYGQQQYGQEAPRRRTWDLVLTIILLVVGFFGMLAGIAMGSLFNDPVFIQQFNEGLGQQGISGSVEFGSFSTIVTVSHLVLYLLALGLSILLLVKRKIAFYVPLVAGVIAAIIFWGGYFAVILSAIDMTQFSR